MVVQIRILYFYDETIKIVRFQFFSFLIPSNIEEYGSISIFVNKQLFSGVHVNWNGGNTIQ